MKRKAKILIVDDYHRNIEALATIIESEDVESYSAISAEQALELLTQNDFDLALIDVQMPNMSGFELAKLIRGVKRYRHIPIIFVTASPEDRAIIFQGYETGAVDVLFKPLDTHVVRRKVQVFVELSQQRALLEEHAKELEKLKIRAEAANIAKSQFLANMSHEIRTPLAAVLGFTELLLKEKLSNEERIDAKKAIQRNGKLLLRLIDDVLDLSKIEANRLEFENISFDLGELLKDVYVTLSFKAREKGIELEFHTPTSYPHSFYSDPSRLKQILLNIIGNAIKFTPAGGVKVHVQLQENNDKTTQFQVRVEDSGIGLAPDQIKNLFRSFGQADLSTRRKFGGSGLGLVISRELARVLGGELQLISSTQGKGSIFEISLPLPHAIPQQSSAAMDKTISTVESTLKGKRILAVDDSADNLTLLQMFLRSTEAEILCADNGREAIHQVQQGQFDLILMDVQMPEMDGHQTTEALRKLGFSKPIIALTAHATKAEHDKCRVSGCDEVLSKPINPQTLIRSLQKFLKMNS